MNKKQKQELRQRQTARQLMGISQLTGHGVRTAEGELAFFLIRPDNLSVLSEEGVRGRVTALTHLLCAMPELRILALDSRESFQRNQEWYRQRLEQEEPVLDALLSWANEMQARTAPKSALGKAIYYLLEQWPYLTRYLEDGRLELSNNRAERSIKPFVMGRKNWLFANTPGGAQASSVIYSLMETAKENDLDPYRYLLWVLRNAPGLSKTDEAWAEKLLPANAPEVLYASKIIDRHLDEQLSSRWRPFMRG